MREITTNHVEQSELAITSLNYVVFRWGYDTTHIFRLELSALLGFERWQSENKGLPLGSVKCHLGSIDGVEASRVEVVLV